MIWIIIFYALVAAVVCFGLCMASIKLEIRSFYGTPMLWPAIVCGIVWPVAAPIYAAYLAAIWYSKRR